MAGAATTVAHTRRAPAEISPNKQMGIYSPNAVVRGGSQAGRFNRSADRVDPRLNTGIPRFLIAFTTSA